MTDNKKGALTEADLTSAKVQSESLCQRAPRFPVSPPLFTFQSHPLVVSLSECRNVFSCGVYSTSGT